MSKFERTGWRHLALSGRHRAWGVNCPAVDIDWLVIEYDQAIACAVVEYKNEQAALCMPHDPNRRAMVDLCNRAILPYIGCRYASDFKWFCATPLNKFAVRFVPCQTRLTEQEWVTVLYALRGRRLPKLDIFNNDDHTF